MKPGDGVGFPAGTGIAHTFLNNSEGDVRLLVVGEASRERSRIDYPLHPRRNLELGERHWKDRPERKLGPHNGLPDKPVRNLCGRLKNLPASLKFKFKMSQAAWGWLSY